MTGNRKIAFLVCVSLALLSLAALRAADLQGVHEDPNKDFGKGSNYKLVGDAKLGWMTGELTGDVDLGGHSLTIDTGGGNRTLFSGAISGQGAVQWVGGGVPQVAPSMLNGDKPNTFQGAFTLAKGVLDLDKPAGVDAIPGDLIVGGKESALVKLDQSNQINDASNVSLAGKGIAGLDLQGHDEKFASLAIETHAAITFGDKPASLVIGDSSSRNWNLAKTLTIRGFKLGKDKLRFGDSAAGLAKAQLARIGFAAPAGLPAGLYTAKISVQGELTPATIVAAVNPPFDVSPAAIAHREKVYSVPGRAHLSAKTSPLKDGMTIDFFGDSITWLNGYIGAIDHAIKAGDGSTGRRIELVNRGINGGGAVQLRDGAKEAGFPGNSAQKPFAELIAADKADLAVVYIGINDVWWRNTPADVFEKALRDMVASASSNSTKLVLATLSVHGEFPDGKNSDDAKIERYAEITRKVARDTGTTLVDLRGAYIAYLQNNNAELRVDGTIYSAPSGIVTYDGVHPNAQGIALLADLIGDGILRALEQK